MAELTIDTTSNQYQQLLNGLGTLRTLLGPRIKMLLKADRDVQKAWLQRDPLLRRTILLARKLSKLVDLELDE